MEKGIIILYKSIYKQEVFLLHLINIHYMKPPSQSLNFRLLAFVHVEQPHEEMSKQRNV